MKHVVNSRIWVLMCLAGLAIMPAAADVVTYSTTGVFGSSGTNVYSGLNALTITYGDTAGNVVSPVPPPSDASFGTFTVVGPLAGYTDTVSTAFTLTIAQTTPSGGSETFTDSFKGTVTISSSSILLKFSSGNPIVPVSSLNPITGAAAWEFNLGDGLYWIDATTPIHPSTTNSGNLGVSSIDGAVSSSNVPDGGMTLMLLGGALVGLATMRRKFAV
jgi:hypothetical protein